MMRWKESDRWLYTMFFFWNSSSVAEGDKQTFPSKFSIIFSQNCWEMRQINWLVLNWKLVCFFLPLVYFSLFHPALKNMWYLANKCIEYSGLSAFLHLVRKQKSPLSSTKLTLSSSLLPLTILQASYKK